MNSLLSIGKAKLNKMPVQHYKNTNGILNKIVRETRLIKVDFSLQNAQTKYLSIIDGRFIFLN